MKRRPFILLIFAIILLTLLWLVRGWWLPFFQNWLSQLAGDIGNQIQSIEAFVGLVVLLGGGILWLWSWLARGEQANRHDDELAPLKATTWQTIRERSPQGARVAWIDRGATDANQWRAQPRLALIGLSGEGKSREAAELIRQAVELDLVAATNVFEPNRDFLHAGAALTTAVLEKVVEPTQRACLFMDDLHSYSATMLEQLATLLALFTHPQLDHRYVIATVRSDLVSAEQQVWLTQQGFHLVRLPKIDTKQAEQWLTSAGQVHSLTLSKKVRQTFIEQNQSGTPGHLLRGLLTIKSSLADNNKGQIKPVQVAAVMSDLTAQERQALYRRQPLAVYLLTALAHFHAAEVRTAQPLILAYAAMHYRRDHRLFRRWQARWRDQTLRRTLTYLLNFDVNLQDGLIAAPDALLESAVAGEARRNVGDFLVNYRQYLHNRLLRRVHRHAEVHRWALFDLAQGYREQQEPAVAARFYKAAIGVAPHFGLYVNLGNARADQGALSAAIADYSTAIQLNSQYAVAYINRGSVYADRGEWSAAIIDYNSAIRLNPQDPIAYNNRGIAHKAQDALSDAIVDYDIAIRLNPRYSIAYVNRGNAYATLGDLNAAVADYDIAIQIDPDYALAYVNRGNARSAKGEWTAAIADYDIAIQIDPQNTIAHINRGIGLYAYQGALMKDISNFGDLIRFDRRDTNNGGNIRKSQQQLSDTIAHYTSALEKVEVLPSQGLNVYRSLGVILREEAKWAEVSIIYRQVLALDYSQFRDWVALADAARHLGDRATFLEAIAQANKRLPLDDAYNRACLESVAGNVEEALAALTQAAQADNFDPTWAHQDPDLAWVRADSRFAEIVGKIIATKDISADKLEQAEGERQVTVAETKSTSKT